jgi:glucosamine kinase
VTISPDTPEVPDVVVGIDAGGTNTRARALRGGDVVHEGTGGPGNPLSADKETLEDSYRAALAGCPAAACVCACVAGTARPDQRDQVAALLARHFPDAKISVVPDYVGAFCAAPEGTGVSVIAGTGSVICSRSPDGCYAVSGGLGWILSDHGSAVRLGQAALEHIISGLEPVREPVATALIEAFGTSDPCLIAHAVNSSVKPTRLLASAAPLLTAAAEHGAAWAAQCLDYEMAGLAGTTAQHIVQNVSQPGTVRVALTGGVWKSPVCVTSFASAITRLCSRPVDLARAPGDPIEGAVRLAQGMMAR